MIEAQTSDFKQDGSISIKVDGKDITFVKESDLGAVKGALSGKEGEISKLQADLASANIKQNESHQELLKERTAKEQFEKNATEGATHKTRVGELETELAGLKTSSGEKDTKLAERLRSILVEGYKIDGEKIKDKALGDLEQMEETLKLTGLKAAPANYDGKSGGAVSSASELEGKSPLALATMGYEENRKSK